ncbi:MAG: hypothetical protein WC498_02285 [Candidatus Saccharimonadales bacterium]
MEREIIDQPYAHRTKVLAALACVVVASGCQSESRTPEVSSSPHSTVEVTTGVVTSTLPEPTPTVATSSPEACESIRAVRPNAYFNPSYRTHIDDQLRLIRLGLSPTGNVDIDNDGSSFVQLYHAMEEDPRYADAMQRAYDNTRANPTAVITSEEVLSYDVPQAELCAPQTLTDAASQRQLAETKTVVMGVGQGLLHHLGEQTTRGARAAFLFLQHQMQSMEQQLDKWLQNH